MMYLLMLIRLYYLYDLCINHSEGCNGFKAKSRVLSDIFNYFDEIGNYLLEVDFVGIVESQDVGSLLAVNIFPDINFEVSTSNNKLNDLSMSYF